jgi:3-hydroxyisobutyrate dehydrogenase-like beta-hydroxyacid dehydrogenase
MRVCLLGFGEVGQTLGEDLGRVADVELRTYDIQFGNPRSGPSRAAAAQTEVRRCESAAEAAGDADLVISAVTAAQDAVAARSVVGAFASGAFYLDLNSVSPATKQQVADVVEAAGGRYVEAAVMAPIFPRRSAAPMLIGGPHAEAFCRIAPRLRFTGAEFCSASIGLASATKMCRSVIIKGMESVLTESMLAARHYGVEQRVLASLDNLLRGDDWEALAHYMLSRSAEHGVRRAEEMREAATTVRDAGIEPWMSLATVERQQWIAGFTNALGRDTLAGLLDQVLAEVNENSREPAR